MSYISFVFICQYNYKLLTIRYICMKNPATTSQTVDMRETRTLTAK